MSSNKERYKSAEILRQTILDLLNQHSDGLVRKVIDEHIAKLGVTGNGDSAIKFMKDNNELIATGNKSHFVYKALKQTTFSAELMEEKRISGLRAAHAFAMDNPKPKKRVGVTVHHAGDTGTRSGGQGALRERVWPGASEIV